MLEGLASFVAHGGLFLVFLVLLLEANPLGGLFIPGQSIVFLVGFLASAEGSYNVVLLAMIIFLASFLGDMLGYFIGYRYGMRPLRRLGINEEGSMYKYCKNFFERYGALSVIIGRQANVNRGFVPFLAGISKMRIKKFMPVAFLSGILWTIVSVGLGYYFGEFILEKGESLLMLLLFVALYLVILWVVYKTYRGLCRRYDRIFRKYAIESVLYTLFLLVVFILAFLAGKFIGVTKINSMFTFFVVELSSNLGYVLLTKAGLIVIFGIITVLIVYNKKFKLLESFVGSLFVAVLLTLALGKILDIYLGVEPYYPLVFFIIGIFLLYVSSKEVNFLEKSNFSRKSKNTVLFLILLSGFISAYVREYDFYRVFISFIVATIESELIVLLSHYKILNQALSGCLRESKEDSVK